MSSARPLDALVAATAAGDRAAFAELYHSTSAKLFGVALRILKRRELAEEVLQEAYLAIWRHAGDYRAEKGSPITWMVTITRHRAIDRHRRNRPETPIDDEVAAEAWADPGPDPLESAIQSDALRAISECLSTLERRQRDCILLAFYEGYTHQELAARFDSPLGTVKSWVRRGLIQVKECLEQ